MFAFSPILAAAADAGRSADSMIDLLVAILYLGCGLWCLPVWLRIRKGLPLGNGRWLLVPGGCRDKKCRHPQEYKDAMRGKVLILGIGLLIFGAAFLADHFLGSGSTLIAVLLLALPLGLLAWYAWSMHKAAEKWWE